MNNLIVPRPITHLVLIILGIVAAEVAWHLLPYKLIIYISGLAGPFCVFIAGIIWSMRDKADTAFAGEHLDSGTFLKARKAAQEVSERSMKRATIVIIAALAAFSPLVSGQFTNTIWPWMVIACGIGTAEAIYSYFLAYAWELQIQAVRDETIFSSKEEIEKKALINKIESSPDKDNKLERTWKIPNNEDKSSSVKEK